jgi:hypothetical protein
MQPKILTIILLLIVIIVIILIIVIKKSKKKIILGHELGPAKDEKSRYLISKERTYKLMANEEVEKLAVKSKIVKLINYKNILEKINNNLALYTDKNAIEKYIKVSDNKLIVKNYNKIMIYFQCYYNDKYNYVYKEYKINKELRLHELLRLIHDLSFELDTSTLWGIPDIIIEPNMELSGYISEYRIKEDKIFVECNF